MKLIVTGGTIDSYYETNMCTVVCYGVSKIRNYLSDTVCKDISDIEFAQICMKDSRQITNTDRDEMVRQIEESEDTQFVITHGTYTLFETAKYIKNNTTRKDITVTVTGSLIPLYGFSPSDAPYCLAYAMANSRMNEPGVYVSIKGKIFTSEQDQVLHA